MNFQSSSSLSLADIENEASATKSRLAYLQMKKQQTGGGDDDDDHVANSAAAQLSTAQLLYKRAQRAQDEIEYIGLNRHVQLLSKIGTGMQNNDTNTGLNNLIKATDLCTELGLLLLQHSNNIQYQYHNAVHHHHEVLDQNNSSKSTQLYNSLHEWYNLHKRVKSSAQFLFTSHVTKLSSSSSSTTDSNYPSSEHSSQLIADALSLGGRNRKSSSVCGNGSNNSMKEVADITHVSAKCVVELQVVYDAVQLLKQQHHHQQQQSPIQPQNISLPSSWRLDIVDCLVRPIVERVRFHFLEEQTGILSSSSTTSETNRGQQQQQKQSSSSSKIDKLPEWLFRYLREVIDNHGVLTLVIMEGVQPLIDMIFDSLLARTSLDNDINSNEGELTALGGGQQRKQSPTTTMEIIQQLKSQYYDHSSTYFLREISRIARHAIRAKQFFSHPTVVGSACQDGNIVLRGIEQLFLFDTFLYDKMKEKGEEYMYGEDTLMMLPTRMVDTFLSFNDSLMQWWLDEELKAIVTTLHECASSTLSSYQSMQVEGGGLIVSPDDDDINNRSQQQIYPPISELFVALLHRGRCKANMFINQRSRQMYIANVIAPFCSKYLDLVHGEASLLRKKLLFRSSSSSVVSTPLAIRSNTNLPSNELIISTTMEWAALITGTHLAAQAVLLWSSSSSVLDQVGQSMDRLCQAMVEDYISAFVETIIVDYAKFATYIMRAPFLLSEPPHDDSPGRRGQRDKDSSVGNRNLALSPDLNDSIHLISISVQACNEMKLKIKSIFPQSSNNGSGDGTSIEPSSLLYYGCYAIHEALELAFGQKLLDIALDPQGMTPEIYLGGAMQFQHDVIAFDRLFRSEEGCQRVGNDVVGPLGRAMTASNLMGLESIQTLRETLRALVSPSGRIGYLFSTDSDASTGEFINEQSIIRLDVDDFYKDQRLMKEVTNMLEGRGYGDLDLSEVLSILNRRR